MKPTHLTTLLLATGLAVTAHAHDNHARDDEDHRSDRSASGCREERLDCSRSDRRHARDDRRSRKSRADCDDPPLIIYSDPTYGYGFVPPYPPYPLYAPCPPWYNGRFVPIPIPRRPVYILPGMR
jgi:hypothetical protein